jgi:hypothetical protein
LSASSIKIVASESQPMGDTPHMAFETIAKLATLIESRAWFSITKV